MNGGFYRVDKFVVPEAAREEFLLNVLMVHEVLQVQPGFMGHSVLEQVSGPGEFNFVTIAQWESAEVAERASDSANPCASVSAGRRSRRPAIAAAASPEIVVPSQAESRGIKCFRRP